jgi:hypothetical protein
MAQWEIRYLSAQQHIGFIHDDQIRLGELARTVSPTYLVWVSVGLRGVWVSGFRITFIPKVVESTASPFSGRDRPHTSSKAG